MELPLLISVIQLLVLTILHIAGAVAWQTFTLATYASFMLRIDKQLSRRVMYLTGLSAAFFPVLSWLYYIVCLLTGLVSIGVASFIFTGNQATLERIENFVGNVVTQISSAKDRTIVPPPQPTIVPERTGSSSL